MKNFLKGCFILVVSFLGIIVLNFLAVILDGLIG